MGKIKEILIGENDEVVVWAPDGASGFSQPSYLSLLQILKTLGTPNDENAQTEFTFEDTGVSERTTDLSRR